MTNLAFPNIVPPNDQTKFETYPGYEWAYRLTKGFRDITDFENSQPPPTPGAVNITATTPIIVVPSPITGTGVISHADSGVISGTYGDSADVGQFLVDVKGHIDTAKNVPINAPVITNQAFVHGIGEPQNNAWIEFSPVGITTLQAGGAPGGGGVSPGVFTQHRRLVCNSTTGTPNNCAGQVWNTANVVWRGNAPFNGGFLVVMAQGVDANASPPSFSSDSRYCVALTGSGPLGNINHLLPNQGTVPTQEPSTFISGSSGALAILKDSTDTNLQLFAHNGTTGVKTDLGSSWKVNPLSDWFIISFSALPNDSKVSWSINNVSTGAQISGSVGSPNVFPNNVWLCPLRYVDQGPSQTAAVRIALGPYYWLNQY